MPAMHGQAATGQEITFPPGSRNFYNVGCRPGTTRWQSSGGWIRDVVVGRASRRCIRLDCRGGDAGHISPVLLQGLDTFLNRGMLLACHSHRDVEAWRRTCPGAFKRLPLSKYEHLPLARRLFSSVEEFASGDLLFQVLATNGSQSE